jgi:hypothetical protein
MSVPRSQKTSSGSGSFSSASLACILVLPAKFLFRLSRSIFFPPKKNNRKRKTKVSVSNPQSLLGWTIHTIDGPMDWMLKKKSRSRVETQWRYRQVWTTTKTFENK